MKTFSTLFCLLPAISLASIASAEEVPLNKAEPCPETIGNLPVTSLGMMPNGKFACQISGQLERDASLSNEVDWYLEGALQVGYENWSPTLTIEAGTTIYGDNQDFVDYIVVYPGASLQAKGTSSAPIHFLSDDEDTDGTGEWGGVFIRGEADLQGDNLLDYVVVAEGGAEVQTTDYTYKDNIALEGVSDATRLSFVQSHDSARDGIWIKNSAARLSWILVTGATRDGIWYRDFNGVVKDLMVLHRPESGRSGIYASATELKSGISNPRFVNITLFDMDTSIEDASADASKRQFGILFADYTIEGEFANVSIGNFKHGCYEAEPTADLSNLSIDGVHCVSNFGDYSAFRIIREGGVDFPNVGTGNGEGIRYYNGLEQALLFTGQASERKFTAGWYVSTVGDITNGLTADSNALHGFNQGDTNNDGVVDAADNGASPLLGDSGTPLSFPRDSITGFNDDVADDTYGYDLTHNGSVRSGADDNASQWNGWTVSTGPQQGFCAMDMPTPPALSPTPPPIDLSSRPTPSTDNCIEGSINFDEAVLGRFADQDVRGRQAITDDGCTLVLSGNNWKIANRITHFMTPSTVLRFEMYVENPGEVQGIFLDTENPETGNGERTFNLAGMQEWGLSDYRYVDQGGYQTMEIPVGLYFAGYRMYIGFANDDDKASQAITHFRNVRFID